MDDPLQHARELAASLLAEIARLRRETPDDAELLGAEHAARDVIARLAARGIVDPPIPDKAGIIRPPYPGAAPDPGDDA
jgi:hypothetical protein